MATAVGALDTQKGVEDGWIKVVYLTNDQHIADLLKIWG